jgi:hypothetical protein
MMARRLQMLGRKLVSEREYNALKDRLEALEDKTYWRCHTKVERYEGDVEFEVKDTGLLVPRSADNGLLIKPYDVTEIDGNVLTIGGASVQWQTLIGNGTTTAGQVLTYFNNAQAAIGVGDSTTAAADTQTNLSAATNKLRKAMDSTYPQHTDSNSTAGAKSIIFRSTFATGDANWAWQEWGVFNSTTDGTGRMLNRKVESLGTKTSAASWTITITLSLA